MDAKKLEYALEHRYAKQDAALPPEIVSICVLFDLIEQNLPLVKDLQRHGPQVTSSLGAVKDFLARHPSQDITERQVAAALLYMVLSPARQQYSPTIFLSAIHDALDTEYWINVIRGLDIERLDILKDQFLTIYNALLPIARKNSELDIQILWAGQWEHAMTQLSFLRSFLSCTPDELDASIIPGLRQAYSPQDMSDGPEDVVHYAEIAQRDPTISIDAIMAVYDILINSDELSAQERLLRLKDSIVSKGALFLCSSLGIPKPWDEGQNQIMKGLLAGFLRNDQADSSYALYTSWRQDKHWVAQSLIETHLNDPLELITILERAQENEWLEDLYTLFNGFGIDLAALAHRKGHLDLKQWAEDKLAKVADAFVVALWKFLGLKSDEELRIARDEQPAPRTVSLSLKTVSCLLGFLDQHMLDRVELKHLQRQCLQAYPRLIIDSEGLNNSLEVDYKQSNRLSRAADQEMSDLYKRMYNDQLEAPYIVEYLKECRASDDPDKLDIFACMIHGLFDEFSCFGEYPLGPLSVTAVLFGGIMSVRLITGLALRVGQDMILDAVRDFPPEAPMYKFGLQALIQISERLKEPEWSDFCSQLVHIPELRGSEAYQISIQNLTDNGVPISDGNAPSMNGMADGLPNGDIDSFLSSDTIPQFKSVNAEPASDYDEPDENTQEKVVFFFNNVSEQNVKSRLSQLQEALQDIQPQWFASFLVDDRAKVEPNYQPLYLDILKLLGNKVLWNEVLRETYVSVKRLLNAESTMQSASERKNLKNLSTWLGSLTMARDKPIKHKNISFLDLLIEGYETQRLNLVIPFTCNVLVQGTRSIVFKPPNPWIVEIMAALLELYLHFDIKLNHKFEIEVLFKEFGSPMAPGAESDNIRNRPLHDESIPNNMLPEGPDTFEDATLGGINRTVRNPRFDLDSISSALPDLESIIVFPPATGSSANQAKLHEIVLESIRRAILEIIAPVVERSVTIATISTSALIRKDFAREQDEDRVRRSAQQMARQLSGSLALVTCKEPLKMSMSNNIRLAIAELPDQNFPEGAILMCVNDNLDAACSIVEKQAEERSMPEIEVHIEAEINIRRQHRISNPNQSFEDPSFSHWSTFIPEPYKQSFEGLNNDQMNIYVDFARQFRGAASHGQTSSADSGRQLPDVLQDAYASIPNVHTPATDLSMPHQTQHQQHHQPARMLHAPTPNSVSTNHTNGYMNLGAVQDRMQDLLGDTSRLIQENPEKSVNDLPSDLPAVVENLDQVWDLIVSTPDSIAMNCAEEICKNVHNESMTRLQIEVFVHLLARLCQAYANIRKEVALWVTSQGDLKMLNTDVTIALVKFEIMSLKQVDVSVTGLLYDRFEGAIEFFSEILDALLLNDHPFALRADFTRSLAALGHWAVDSPSHQSATALLQKLEDWGVRQLDDNGPDERGLLKKQQLQYIFIEWIGVCNAHPKIPADHVFSPFIFQLHRRQLLNSEEDMTEFVRLCIDECLETYILASMDSTAIKSAVFLKVDCLARLIVLLVRNQGEQDGAVRLEKAGYMKSILGSINLIINHQQIQQGERLNQRVFFRLYSSILCDWHDFGREGLEQDNRILLVFADSFIALSPCYFPAFIYGWLMLISHRHFMPNILKLSDDRVSNRYELKPLDANIMKRQGWEPFVEIMEKALGYICQSLKPDTISLSPLAIDLYRGVLRIILVLHHDFPEFLAENHFRLCNSIPRYCTQLYNLILSAYPSSFPELPSAYVAGLKVDRLEEMKKEPRMVGDYTTVLRKTHAKNITDIALKRDDISDDDLGYLRALANVSSQRNPTMINALVLYIGQSAVATAGHRAGQAFLNDSPQAHLLTRLAKELRPEARYYFFSAMVNQLRYPNSHTQYFSHALLHLFGCDLADQQESDFRQQIVRILLERLHVIRPHPWGLMTTIVELIKNPDYALFQLPFIKASPPVSIRVFQLLVKMLTKNGRSAICVKNY